MQTHQHQKSEDFNQALKFFLHQMRCYNWIRAHSNMLKKFTAQTSSDVGQHCHDVGYVRMDRGRVVLTIKGSGEL